MNRSDFGPLMIVISRDEVERNDTSGPLSVLKSLLADPNTIRANRTDVDVSFFGYDDTREELFEIPEVRNFVHALDMQFPFWLYFLSRDFLGLQCIAYCHLLPFLTPEARQQRHPRKLAELIETRWAPALFDVCACAGHSDAEANALLVSALAYFKSGPTKPSENTGGEKHPEAEEESEGDAEPTADDTATLLALKPSQEFVRIYLEKACRAALARADQEPHSLLLGALFLRAVLGLPFAVDQFPIQLSWKIDYGESWGMKTVTIGHEHLGLDTTEAFDSGMGWDSESKDDWSVDELRQRGLYGSELEEALTDFAEHISYPDCKVYFSTDCDHPFEEIASDPDAIDWHTAFTVKDEGRKLGERGSVI